MPCALVPEELSRVGLHCISEAALRLEVHVLRSLFIQATACSGGVVE
jgi:hypothetical protein